MSIPTFVHGLSGMLWLCSVSFVCSGASFLHVLQLAMFCFTSTAMPCQNMVCLARRRVASIPWWLTCRRFNMSPRILVGITTHGPLYTTPSRIASSSRNVHHGRTCSGTLVTSVGQPFLMTSDNCCRTLSRSVSSLIVTYSVFVTGQSLTGSIISNCRH